MPVPRYGVLTGRVFARRTEPDDLQTPHYHLAVAAQTGGGAVETASTLYRVAVNVRARDGVSENDHHLRVAVCPLPDNWQAWLRGFEDGFTPLDSGQGLDYVRQGVVKAHDFVRLAPSLPGAGNDLNDTLDRYVARAITRRAKVCAFGSMFGPIPQSDPFFGWAPSQGMHNVHRNQGSPNPGRFADDNGVYTDGALFVQNDNGWVGLFLQFATQQWRTSDTTGHPI